MSTSPNTGPRPDPFGYFYNIKEASGWILYRHIDEEGRRSWVNEDTRGPKWFARFDDGQHQYLDETGSFLEVLLDGTTRVTTDEGKQVTVHPDRGSTVNDGDVLSLRTPDGILTELSTSALGELTITTGFLGDDRKLHIVSEEPLDGFGDNLLDGGPQ